MGFKKYLIILIIICSPCFSYALDGVFEIEEIIISPTQIDFISGSDSFYCTSLILFDDLKFAYQSGHNVGLNYDADGKVNYITLDAKLYPVNDFSKIASFLIGGIACFAFVLGITIKF